MDCFVLSLLRLHASVYNLTPNFRYKTQVSYYVILDILFRIPAYLLRMSYVYASYMLRIRFAVSATNTEQSINRLRFMLPTIREDCALKLV